MTSTSIENEVLQLEKRYWDAMKARDLATVQSLTADPCLVVGSQGPATISWSQFSEMMQSDAYTIRSFELADSEAAVRKLSDGVVAVAYKVSETFDRNGTEQQLEAYDCSIWVRQNGGWRCAVHTETPSARQS